MNATTTNSTIDNFALDNVVGISVALGVNVLVTCFAIVVFLMNKACVLPILLCQSAGFQLMKKAKKNVTLVNTFSIFQVPTSSIPKLIILNLVVAFIILRVAMLVFRIVQNSINESAYSVFGAIGSVLFILGAGCNVSLFSTFLLLWIQFIHSINKAQRIMHPAGFVLFLVIMGLANIIVWVACIAVAITFAIPKASNMDATMVILSALIPGSVFILGIALLDVVMLIAGICIIAMLVRSYQLQKRMLKNTVDQDAQTQLLNYKTKQLATLATRFAVVIVVFLFSINIIILGLIIIAVGGRAWIITIFIQTIPECLAVISICIFFIPFSSFKSKSVSVAPIQTSKLEMGHMKLQSTETSAASPENFQDELSIPCTPQSPTLNESENQMEIIP